jgi:hypothetical protein
MLISGRTYFPRKIGYRHSEKSYENSAPAGIQKKPGRCESIQGRDTCRKPAIYEQYWIFFLDQNVHLKRITSLMKTALKIQVTMPILTDYPVKK